MACLTVNTTFTEDSSGLECEAVSHTPPSCVDTLLGQPDPEDEVTVTLHNTGKYSYNNTATLVSKPQILNKIHTLFIAYNKGSLPGISKLSIWPVYYLSLTPQLSATLNQVTMLLKYIPPTLVLFYCNCYCYRCVLHATHKTSQKKKTLTILSSKPLTHIPGGNDDRRSLISFLTVRKKFCGSVGWNIVSLNLWLLGAESIIENPENYKKHRGEKKLCYMSTTNT